VSARRLFCDADTEFLCPQCLHINSSVAFLMTTAHRKATITGTAGRFLWRSFINVSDLFTLVVSYYYFWTLLKALQLMCTGLLTAQFPVLAYFLSKRRKWASLDIRMLVCVCVWERDREREREREKGRERQTDRQRQPVQLEVLKQLILFYGSRKDSYDKEGEFNTMFSYNQ
jgi:hypothetical protein